MEWDLGPVGLALLAGMSLGFGLVAQLLAGRTTPRGTSLVAAVVYFVSGLLISELWFGWATEEDLQPNIDGLSFDEVLLIGLLPGTAVVVAGWLVSRRSRRRAAAAGAGAQTRADGNASR
jgi:hypothetical protein